MFIYFIPGGYFGDFPFRTMCNIVNREHLFVHSFCEIICFLVVSSVTNRVHIGAIHSRCEQINKYKWINEHHLFVCSQKNGICRGKFINLFAYLWCDFCEWIFRVCNCLFTVHTHTQLCLHSVLWILRSCVSEIGVDGMVVLCSAREMQLQIHCKNI